MQIIIQIGADYNLKMNFTCLVCIDADGGNPINIGAAKCTNCKCAFYTNMCLSVYKKSQLKI